MEDRNLDILLDVKVKITVQLGSSQLPMREVMELQPGSVIQLNQLANDPVGLYVNDKLIAYGEVVVVEDNFGIKVTELVGTARWTASTPVRRPPLRPAAGGAPWGGPCPPIRRGADSPSAPAITT